MRVRRGTLCAAVARGVIVEPPGAVESPGFLDSAALCGASQAAVLADSETRRER